MLKYTSCVTQYYFDGALKYHEMLIYSAYKNMCTDHDNQVTITGGDGEMPTTATWMVESLGFAHTTMFWLSHGHTLGTRAFLEVLTQTPKDRII